VLSMEQHELIRRMVCVDGLSQREVARRLGHSRKTVAKALQSAAPPGYTREEPRPRPKLQPYIPIVRQWLLEDQQRHRKQRHTAVRVFERLRDEHDFQGQRRTVSDLVKELRREITQQEIFVPIEHPPGAEVQIDWGEADFILNGQTTRVMLFCARLPYSKATYARAYMREDQPSFLDAHVHLIAYLGGVPHTFAYDNLKSAVTKIVGRERALSKKFLELRSHYLFKTRFCNVARGNEKGHTENAVKRTQRNYMTPLPAVTSIDQLNEHLLERCKADLDRIDTGSGKSYGDLLAIEQTHFAETPQAEFTACINRPARVDRYATVQFDETRYSVPCRYASMHSVVRVGIDTVDVIVDNEIVARHHRGSQGEWVLQMEHYLPILERKPGLLDSGKPFVKSQFSDAELLMRRELEYRYAEDGTRQFLNILMLGKEHDFSLVRQAIENCSAARAFHEEAVRLELHRLEATPPARSDTMLDLTARPELQNISSKKRDLSIYDALATTAGHDDTDQSVPFSISTQWSANHDNPISSFETESTNTSEDNFDVPTGTGDSTESRERLEASPAPNVLGGILITLCAVFS
jgi:transposase